jgi:hypothetical protein
VRAEPEFFALGNVAFVRTGCVVGFSSACPWAAFGLWPAHCWFHWDSYTPLVLPFVAASATRVPRASRGLKTALVLVDVFNTPVHSHSQVFSKAEGGVDVASLDGFCRSIKHRIKASTLSATFHPCPYYVTTKNLTAAKGARPFSRNSSSN